jgi:uncharacterized protein YecE (DUF72 family)
MEFRHKSWEDDEVAQILSEHEVAKCGADTDDAPIDAVPVTAPHSYLRLRKEEYGQDELEQWGRRIAGTLAENHDVFCYLKHEGGGVGPVYALKILEVAQGAS